jgi:hypothetical protein
MPLLQSLLGDQGSKVHNMVEAANQRELYYSIFKKQKIVVERPTTGLLALLGWLPTPFFISPALAPRLHPSLPSLTSIAFLKHKNYRQKYLHRAEKEAPWTQLDLELADAP